MDTEHAKTVGLAFQEMQPVLDTFRRNYIKVLEAALKRFEVGNLRVCTVYNGILTCQRSHEQPWASSMTLSVRKPD